MRTPIQSMIIVAKQILQKILGLKRNKDTELLIKCCKIIISQLYFVETFTEDLLNISMIQEGVFKLEKSIFNPQEALTFISEMFEQKAICK